MNFSLVTIPGMIRSSRTMFAQKTTSNDMRTRSNIRKFEGRLWCEEEYECENVERRGVTRPKLYFGLS